MRLPSDTKIAGDKTIEDWESLKKSLNNCSNNDAWVNAYSDFYLARLTDRYLNPIKCIKDKGAYKGEGFSIMAILCSLIEFLEGVYQGKSFRYKRNGDPPLEIYEYNQSSNIFISFLIHRNPFDRYFDKDTAEDFYQNVRCGLLHEARTNGKWTIKGSTLADVIFEKNLTESVVYRDNYLHATIKFIETYKNDLLLSSERKDAFIRKFDRLCFE